MRSFFFKHKRKINLLLPIIITLAIFASDGLQQKISEIYTSYIIDTNTLNNSFVTLSVFVSAEDSESLQKQKNNLNEQMKQFNMKYDKLEEKLNTKKTIQGWIDRLIYTLTLLLILLNVIVPREELIKRQSS